MEATSLADTLAFKIAIGVIIVVVCAIPFIRMAFTISASWKMMDSPQEGLAPLLGLLQRWRPQLREVELDRSLTIRFHHRSGKRHYIPVKMMEPALLDLLQTVKTLDLQTQQFQS